MNEGKQLFGNAVQEFYVEKIRAVNKARKRRIAALKTADDVRNYAAKVKRKIHASFQLPTEKTPLEAMDCGSFSDCGITIHKIIYHSRPQYPVTGNLYVPDHAKNAPGVLFLCGHSQEGKVAVPYQTVARTLAHKGYVVLAIDPAGQGERYQLLDYAAPDSYFSCCHEHNLLGKQMSLVGDYFGTWRAWDAIRGIDYLLTRPEVDSSRIGVTGNSGGGTMTAFVNALDDRISMAGSSCYLSSWLRNIENELPADVEQIPPGLAAAGVEMADLVIAQAPRPFLIMGQKNDFFDHRGTLEIYREVKSLYQKLGAGNNVQCFIGPTSHGYSVHNRQAMYEFFNHVAGMNADNGEPERTPIPEPMLQCAPNGQIHNLPGVKVIPDFTHAAADEWKQNRAAHTAAELKRILRSALHLGSIRSPYYRVLRPSKPDGTFRFSRFGLESEPGSVMCVLKKRDEKECFHLTPAEDVLLYIPHLNAETELRKAPLPTTEFPVYGLDVRGIGECMPLGCDQYRRGFFDSYLFDYHFSSLGILFDEPYVGGKVKDILCAIELLKSECGAKISLCAAGQGAIPALFAAFLAGNKVTALYLKQLPPSYDRILRTVLSKWPPSCMIRGILKEMDLPDLYPHVHIVRY